MTQAATLVVRAQSPISRSQPVTGLARPQLRFQQRNSRRWRYQLERQLPDGMPPRLGQFLDVLA